MRININIATSWNELSERQLGQVAWDLEYYNKKLKQYREEELVFHQLKLFQKLQLDFIRILLSVNGFFKTWYALKQIPPSEYIPFLKFLTSECERTIFLKAFKLKGKLYYPPANRIQNLTMKEFSFVDSLFYNWKKTQNEAYLNFLVATLYRPAAKDADTEIDPRVKFDKVRAENAVKIIKKLPRKKKLAIACAFEGSRNYLVQQYPNVFPKPEEEEDRDEDHPKKAVKEPVYAPFGKLIHHKIQYDQSKLELVQNLNIHDFFGSYENELIELKKTSKP